MSERTAIVTLAIGDEFAARWQRLCEENWRMYAERHGYDLICVTDPLDDSQRARDRSPSWQKLLVLGQAFAGDYDRIVWVDADVVFGVDAPAITAGVPVDKVGAVDEYELPEKVRGMIHAKPLDLYYGEFGLPGHFGHIVQAGVMVCSPQHHREVFQHVYDNYEDKPQMYYEMRPLSYELLDAGLVHWIDPRFNRLWVAFRSERYPWLLPFKRHPKAPRITKEALSESYCLHFAAEADQMEFCLRGDDRPRPRVPERERAVETPVAFFVFARPDTTARVLDGIRKVRPSRLLVVADGARHDVEGEVERCEVTRALLETVDWECAVSTNFAEENLGQTARMQTGLDWVFEQAEEAIILEDDLVPDPTFFRFCDEMLERYRDEERILSVGGSNLLFDGPVTAESYHFSRYSPIWGWASWRRAWRHHDPEMRAWPELRDSGWIREQFPDPNAVAYWQYILDRAYAERDAWDLIWLFASLLQGGLHAIPSANMISNVGFRGDATHTRPEHGFALADLPRERIEFPLHHPSGLAANQSAERFTDRLLYGGMVSEMFKRVRHTRQRAKPTVVRT